MPRLGWQGEGQRGEVSLIGCLAVKARVGPPTVVKSEVLANRSASLADAVVASQIHLLVFDAAPQPLDDDVVSPRTLAVHADCDAVLDQQAGERGARKLRALVRVEYLRLAVLRQRLLQCLDAECRLHGDRHAP